MPVNGTEYHRPLTVKQEAFCHAYLETSNASEAYRRAYDVGATTKPEVIWVKACEVLKNGKVAVRIAELQAEHAKRHAVTIDSLTQMLREDRELARKEGEPNAAVNAVMAIAKLHGHVVERKNVQSTNQHTHVVNAVSALDGLFAEALGGRAESDPAETVPN